MMTVKTPLEVWDILMSYSIEKGVDKIGEYVKVHEEDVDFIAVDTGLNPVTLVDESCETNDVYKQGRLVYYKDRIQYWYDLRQHLGE